MAATAFGWRAWAGSLAGLGRGLRLGVLLAAWPVTRAPARLWCRLLRCHLFARASCSRSLSVPCRHLTLPGCDSQLLQPSRHVRRSGAGMHAAADSPAVAAVTCVTTAPGRPSSRRPACLSLWFGCPKPAHGHRCRCYSHASCPSLRRVTACISDLCSRFVHAYTTASTITQYFTDLEAVASRFLLTRLSDETLKALQLVVR